MKKTLKSIVLLGALCGGSLHATFQFRSPLSLEDRGYMHWLLAPADQAWWYDMMPSEKKNTPWNIHIWGAGYTRQADRAFSKHDECQSACPNARSSECNRDKVTRNTATLSQLFFGQQVFRGEEVFAGGTFAGTTTAAQQIQLLVNSINPFLSFAQIAPDFKYNEQGCNMGIDFARYVGRDDRWHVGGRINIPFKIIEVEQEEFSEEGLDDVFVTRIIDLTAGNPPLTLGEPNDIEYAMRYDFLSSLVFTQTALPSGTQVPVPVITYTGSGATANVQLFGSALSAPTSSTNDDAPSAYATISACGDIPLPPFRKNPTQVTQALGADGQGANGTTYFFETGVDYADNLANDRAAQATVFVTPRSIADSGILTDASQAILTNVQAIITGDLLVAEPASTFFLNNGIDLDGFSRVVGIGDLATEFYFGRGHYDDWFVDGIFGLQFPTGKRQKNSNDVYYQTTGNNGHVEVKLEIDGGWKPRTWFAFEIRPAFSHVFRRSENRAASFAGATIMNIGPEIEVDVSWNYFVLRTDFSFFHPHNPDLGFILGYELFAKGHDHVSLQCNATTATDLLGQTSQPLAVCNYENNTNSLSNKLRGEIFYRCNYFEIFGGGTQMVSGRNIMKETQGHIGLAIYF